MGCQANHEGVYILRGWKTSFLQVCVIFILEPIAGQRWDRRCCLFSSDGHAPAGIKTRALKISQHMSFFSLMSLRFEILEMARSAFPVIQWDHSLRLWVDSRLFHDFQNWICWWARGYYHLQQRGGKVIGVVRSILFKSPCFLRVRVSIHTKSPLVVSNRTICHKTYNSPQ